LAYTTGTTDDILITMGNYDHQTRIYDPRTGMVRVLADGESGEWTKDGTLLLVNKILGGGSGGTSRDVYAINVQLGQMIRIQSHITKSPGIFTWFNTDNKYFYGSHQVSSDATSKNYMGGELMGVSQNGEMGLIYRDNQSIHCVNFENNSDRKLLDTYRDEVPAVIWPAVWTDLSADGRWASIFYIGIKDGEEIGGTYLFDCAGEKEPLETGSMGVFSPDSRWLATIVQGSTQVIDLSTGRPVHNQQFKGYVLKDAYWITSSDKAITPGPEKRDAVFEGQIAYIGQDGNVYILRGDTGETIQVTRDATATERYGSPKFSPNAKHVAFRRVALPYFDELP
jgi:hypothetical protein